MEKQVWNMIDLCKVRQKVDFGEPVTIEKAVEMWMNEEYADVLDMDIEEFLEAR